MVRWVCYWYAMVIVAQPGWLRHICALQKLLSLPNAKECQQTIKWLIYFVSKLALYIKSIILGDKSHLIHNTLSRKKSLKWIIFGILYIIHQPIQTLGDITGTVFIKT